MAAASGAPRVYRLIIAAVSERREGLYTVEYAARIAAAAEARLVVYHAVDPGSIPLPEDSPLYREILWSLRSRARALLEAARAIAESAGVARVETVKLEGDPVEGLWRVVERVGRPDLIVIGYPHRRLLGALTSRSLRIVRGAPSSVLVVAPPGQGHPGGP